MPLRPVAGLSKRPQGIAGVNESRRAPSPVPTLVAVAALHGLGGRHHHANARPKHPFGHQDRWEHDQAAKRSHSDRDQEPRTVCRCRDPASQQAQRNNDSYRAQDPTQGREADPARSLTAVNEGDLALLAGVERFHGISMTPEDGWEKCRRRRQEAAPTSALDEGPASRESPE